MRAMESPLEMIQGLCGEMPVHLSVSQNHGSVLGQIPNRRILLLGVYDEQHGFWAPAIDALHA